MTELQALADRLDSAKDYTEIFGKEPTTTADKIKVIYRRLARIAHPDPYEGDEHDVATAAFQKLNDFHDNARSALAEDRFGEPVVQAVIRGRNAVHQIKRQIGVGDIATLWEAQTTTEHATLTTFIKIAKLPRDRDLMKAEESALKKLHANDSKWTRHFPLLVDSFIHEDNKERRAANALGWYGDWWSLSRIHEIFCSPDYLSSFHVAWIWRRLLQALRYAHDQGIVHGAIVPSHVLVWPEQHGVVLTDWCYSVQKADDHYPPIKALTSGYRDWYPPEVLEKRNPDPTTDLIMAAKTMIYLLGGMWVRTPEKYIVAWPEVTMKVPRQIRAYFGGCLANTPANRGESAEELLRRFDLVLERMGPPWWPRKFVEFVVPPGPTQ